VVTEAVPDQRSNRLVQRRDLDGGHSLMAARLLAKIENELARDLPLAAIFQAPTIDKIARLLHHETAAREISLWCQGSVYLRACDGFR
jgi:acyl carrier protein